MNMSLKIPTDDVSPKELANCISLMFLCSLKIELWIAKLESLGKAGVGLLTGWDLMLVGQEA